MWSSQRSAIFEQNGIPLQFFLMLILLGENDDMFIKPSELMAKEIPYNRHVVLPDVGRMTAIENPKDTIKELLDFLDCITQTGKANW